MTGSIKKWTIGPLPTAQSEPDLFPRSISGSPLSAARMEITWRQLQDTAIPIAKFLHPGARALFHLRSLGKPPRTNSRLCR